MTDPDRNADSPARARKPRRPRSVMESLLSVALALEAALVFFLTMTTFGLRALPPVTTFVGGAILFFAFILAIGVLRFPWGVWVGWVLQVVLLATGFILPMMFFVGGLFVALWIFCFVKARQLTNQQPRTTEETP